ncbi:hypothetical protein NQ317_008057 [Molorchus minor]|uniref:Fibronectin type-III domain-containing protein n=1 Tax=Molorchus minor TaxID=1323400 RepID=A0ABQ9ITU7_9CUCU|nr:hypothetical protein NQ317_008057 [Molorchus minor]
MQSEYPTPVTPKPETAPRNVQVRPLSSSTMVVQWDEPEMPNGQVTVLIGIKDDGYKVYYTTNSELPITQWESQVVDNNQLTTISELTPHTIYTIRVQAHTSVGSGPLSSPVHVKTQQGLSIQKYVPPDIFVSDIGSVTLQWTKPIHSGESIVSYELYWNDTYAKEKHHRRIPILESYTLTGLYPNTLYYVWLAARSQRGEGATTPPIPVRTKHYKSLAYVNANATVVPGAPPGNVVGEAVSPTAIQVSWNPPPLNRSNGNIIYYKIQFVEADRSDSEASEIKFNGTSIILDELKKWTTYRIRVLAGTSVGDGPSSYPITIQTLEDGASRNRVILTWVPGHSGVRGNEKGHMRSEPILGVTYSIGILAMKELLAKEVENSWQEAPGNATSKDPYRRALN